MNFRSTFKILILCQLSELPETWNMLCFPSIIGADNCNFQNYSELSLLSQIWVCHILAFFSQVCPPHSITLLLFQSYQNSVNREI